MNVREIVEEYLKANGFDGLAGDECGCQIGDLAPCGSECMNMDDCEPGYLHECDACSRAKVIAPDDCVCQMEDKPEKGGWCISTEKPEAQS
jgi:hypothetical protein